MTLFANMVNSIRYISKRVCSISKSRIDTIQCVRELSNDLSSRGRTVIGAFPLVRLVFVVVYRITRPFANEFVRRAQENKIFREYVFIPLGKTLNWMDVKIRLRALNLGKLTFMPKIDEKKAVDLGSQLILEFVVLLIFSAIVIYEYNKSSLKEQEKERKRKDEFNEIKDSLEDIQSVVDKQSMQVIKLGYFLKSIQDLVK